MLSFHVFVATQLRRTTNSAPFLIPFFFPLAPKSFPCHTSAKSPVSPSIAALPKTGVSKPSTCRTCETPGASPVTKSSVVHPLSAQPLTKCSLRNSFVLKTIHFHGGCTPLEFVEINYICLYMLRRHHGLAARAGRTQNENQKNFSSALWCRAHGARPLRSAPDFAWLQHCC